MLAPKNQPNRRNTILISGKAKWAKIVGEPSWGYKNAHKEWSIDVYIDEPTQIKLVTEGLESKIKDKGDGPYITFKRKEFKQDGTANKPIRIVDHKGELWNSSTKIGNGSTVNVNFAINEYGKGEKSANILSLQVWDLVPFNGGEFPTKEDDNDNWEKDAA